MKRLVAGVSGFLTSRIPGPSGTEWQRTNFAGDPVALAGGVRAAAGAGVAALVTGGRVGAAGVAAVTAGAVAGYVDDHREEEFESGKGLTGHLKQLSQGNVTTGVLKIGLIGAGAGVAALLLCDRRSVTDWVVRSVAIAGTANLINLLDLRPGRALKVAGAGALLAMPRSGPTAPLLAGLATTVAGNAGEDLAGRTMLGDLGANALGAGLGVAMAAHPNRAVRTVVAGATVGLILASEKVSFSRVIDNNSVLSAIDRWGR